MPCDSLDPPNLSARQMLSAILLFIEENILDRKGFNHERRTNLYSWDAATATTTAPMATPSRSLQQDPMDGSGEEGNTNFAIITIILFVTFILIYLWFCYCLCCCGYVQRAQKTSIVSWLSIPPLTNLTQSDIRTSHYNHFFKC
jgi:hypothetical protein